MFDSQILSMIYEELLVEGLEEKIPKLLNLHERKSFYDFAVARGVI